MSNVIIVAPALEASQNISGISEVTKFIITNNPHYHYQHFLQGKRDGEKHGLHRYWNIINNLVKWNKFLKKNKEYLIHYNFSLDKKSILRDFWFMYIARKKGFKLVIHIHGGLYLFHRKRPYIVKRLLGEIFSWMCPTIVLSELEKERICQDFHVKNVFVLPNCIDLTEPKRFQRGESSRLDILYMGRIEPKKGIDYILAACKIIKANNIDFTLHLAGKEQIGGYIERLEYELGENFIYEGIVFGEMKQKLLKKCNIFLLPSFYEGLPMALLESMSYGLVPIVTNVGSMGLYVYNAENGYIVESKDADSIVNALRELNSDMNKLHDMGSLAQQTIFERFSPEKYIADLCAIYRSV